MKSHNSIFSSMKFAILTLGLLLMHLSYADTGIISKGDAAVTGFSGTIKENQNTPDFIDLSGPSLRVFHLPDGGPYGLLAAGKVFTVTARDVGQVFGVTLDDQSPPNIYVAATSAYGLGIYKDNVGRLIHGEPGAKFVPGQFGPADLSGGPSSIWRIDGVSGKVSLFANVSYNKITSLPASLGGLAYDPITKQIFVSDRGTGMIHYFSLDGTEKGIYDHGAESVPFDPAATVTIENESFNAKQPQTWGYAQPGRRVFGLGVYQNRLFYAVDGPQIWSVGITPDGSINKDAHLEIDTPALRPETEIGSLAFDDHGFLYLAERGAPTGDYDFLNLANGGQNRVLRFARDESGSWRSKGEEYAIGVPPDYQNANGGVALKCNHIVWATGERLLETNAEKFPYIDGLQGTSTDLVKPANMPPEKSWYLNYYDKEAELGARGHLGAIAIWNVCAKEVMPPPPTVACPEGTFFVNGLCLIPPVCPPGTDFVDGYCIYLNCPCGYVRIDNQCVKPPRICDYNEVYVKDRCLPIPCPPTLIRTLRDYCSCPPNSTYQKGRCLPKQCPPNERYLNGRCISKDPCKPGQTFVNGRCISRDPCKPGQTFVNGRCFTRNPCKPGQIFINGQCVRKPCGRGEILRNGVCVPIYACKKGEVMRGGKCIPIIRRCPFGQVMRNGQCVNLPKLEIPLRPLIPENIPRPRPEYRPPINTEQFQKPIYREPMKTEQYQKP